MEIRFERDRWGRMICELQDSGAKATVTSSEPEAAVEAIRRAMAEFEAGGRSECLWREAGGDYRWLFRRHGEMVRVAVLWSAGTLTGWEHRFWAEWNSSGFVRRIEQELSELDRPVG